MFQKQSVEKKIGGRLLSIETGELARAADGAVVVRYADTLVLATAVCSDKPREGIDFFPLTVDYEEKLYAAGKIPGGFFKREGRPSEKSILTSRMIDRPIRPLFPEGFRNEVQIVGLVLSADQQNDSDIPALIGASAALSISDIPFAGPIGGVRIGYRNGEFLINPTFSELAESQINLVVAGTRDAIMMVEAGANEVEEKVVLEALRLAHQIIVEVVELIEELVRKVGKPKREVQLYTPDRDLEKLVREHLTPRVREAMRIMDKMEREKAFQELNKQALIDVVFNMSGESRERMLALLIDEHCSDFDMILKTIEEEELRTMIVDEGLRPDGRRFDEIRPIDCRAGTLPRTHGSGLFTRGQTQVLTTVTLGMISEEQILDGLGGDESKRYMHQYNFPPFSVGETRPMRGPGRREIGHGALAERALQPMIPSEEEFPYTIRLVSEVLESNGSTSMASVCASTMALMDAGVKIRHPVAGIAMGLVLKNDRYVILTDIQGMEDQLGEMDFKVAGSRYGITALQMDIKVKGISMEIMRQALDRARPARMKILDAIEACIPVPREELSPYAPRIIILVIHPDKIKDVIGPGGKIINKIVAETGAKIDIEQDGRIFIAAVDREAGEKAQKMIENLTKEVEPGEIYLGKVIRIMNFGAFVEILPGKEGLVHISQLSPRRVARVEDVVKVGDELPVKVTEIDNQGRINLTAKGLLPSSEPGDGEMEKRRFTPRRAGRPTGRRG